MSSSLFAYEAPALHAPPPPPPPPAAALAVPVESAAEPTDEWDPSKGSARAGAQFGRSDLLGSSDYNLGGSNLIARNRYAHATALSLTDFTSHNAGVAAATELEREAFMCKYASAGAISSAELREGPQSPGSRVALASKLAETGLDAAALALDNARQFGGKAASWLKERAAKLNEDRFR